MSVLDDLRYTFNKGDSALRKIIIINVGFFLAAVLLRFFLWAFQKDALFSEIMQWFELALEPGQLLFQPWSIFTYMFLHVGLRHIFFNMLILYFMGRVLQDFIGNEKLGVVYILGGLAGAVLTMLAYNLMPAVNASSQPYMLGASAGVMAVTLAITTLVPNYTFNLIFLGPVKLIYITAFFLVIDLVSIPQGNPGGHISHLGGALFGYLFIRQLQQGNDWSKRPLKIWEWVINLFKRPSKLKVVHNTRTTYMKTKDTNTPSQDEVDAILDKIHASGYESLSSKEKEVLFKASKDN